MLYASIAVVLIGILLNYGVQHLSRQEYPVHTTGGVIVTGASTGIGRHAAETLAKEGFVVYAGVRKQADVDSLLSEQIDNLVPALLDVTDQESVEKGFATITGDLGARKLPLVGLVNNAGINMGARVIEFTSLQEAQKVFDVNYFGALRMTLKALPALRASQGRLIHISSIGGLFSGPLFGPYAGSKFAIEALADTLRGELLPHKVSVSTVEPGGVHSKFQEKNKIQEQAFATDDAAVKQEADKVYGMFNPPDYAERVASIIEKSEPPNVTSDAILHALTNPHPKTNYVVSNLDGTPCWLFIRLTEMLPKRLIDKMILANFGITLD